VLDPTEAELGFKGNVRLRALEGGAVIEADADLVREGYKERLLALSAPWAAELEARGGRLLRATSSDPPIEVVRQILRAVAEARR